MRRLLLIALVAGAAATAMPAHAQYLVSSGCQDGDWQAIEVSSGGTEYVEVCTSDDPVDVVRQLLRSDSSCDRILCK